MPSICTPRLCAFLAARRMGLAVAAAAFTLDVLSKLQVLTFAQSGTLPWWFIPHQWGFQLQWNTGMSFSLLQGKAWGPWLLAAVAVGASIWFVRWLGESRDALHQWGIGLVLGGALGNLLDRIVHGAVIDFLIASPFGLFPYTFNIADACITVGVALLLAHGFLTRKA